MALNVFRLLACKTQRQKIQSFYTFLYFLHRIYYADYIMKRAIIIIAVLLATLAATNVDAEQNEFSLLLQKIQALPFTPVEPVSPAINFIAYDGDWQVEKDGRVTVRGANGPRLTYAVQKWQKATSGVVQIELRFPNKAAGFSGLCFKISDSGVGPDAFNGYEIGFNPAENVVNLGVHRHNYQRIKLVPYKIPVGEFFTLRLEFEEWSFSVAINGETIAEFQDDVRNPNDPTRAGTFTLRDWANDVEYRNLKVQLRASDDQDAAIDTQLVDAPFLRPDDEGKREFPETLQLDELPPFLYLARSTLNRPNSVGNDLWQATPKRPGCAIRLVDYANPEEPVRTVFQDPNGSIYDMNLSFDAKTIFFSYRPQDSKYWNIWKINVDGSNLKQITNGPFFDVSPVEAPDGDIIFVSTRRFGRTVCQPGPASNLFKMKPDGSQITCVSMNTLSDFNPQILPDGRVLFTRWEYVDRDLTYRQSLWTQNPEGTLYQLYYGNTIREFGSVLQARPIPGAPASRVLATFTPHHGYPHGAIGVVDRAQGIEAGRDQGFTFWTKEFNVVQDVSREYAYRDPFPLDEERALCAFGSNAGAIDDAMKYRIWLLDCDGQKRLLWEEPELDCFCPIPLLETPRPPALATRITKPNLRVKLRPQLRAEELYAGLRKTDGVEPDEEYWKLVELFEQKPNEKDYSVDSCRVGLEPWGIPERMDLLQGDPAGQVVLADVYQGLEPTVPRGAVKKIRIMEQIRKTEELYDRSFDQSPSMGVATYYAKRCWGEVPVEEDGSANFYAPALREIYFQALDSEGREIQRMTSAVQFMPGESVGCVGCHEDRDSIPATAQDESRRPIAALRAPDTPVLPEYLYDAQRTRIEKLGQRALDAGVVDYTSLVQPVLDKYCVSCHDGADPAGGYDLSGDLTRYFCESYEALLLKSRSYRQADMLTGKMPDDQLKLGKPLVQFYWLLFTTSAVNEPYTTGALASRLPDYFSKEHCGVDVDRKSLQRVYFWLDSNAVYRGTYAHTRPKSPGRRDRWAKLDEQGLANWFEKDILPIYNAKCAQCHQNLLGGNRDLTGVHDAVNIDWTGRFAWLDLSRPEKSAFLVAHLPRELGGRGISIAPKDQPAKFVFTSKEDEEWTRALNAIRLGAQDAQERPDSDQPGFKFGRPEP